MSKNYELTYKNGTLTINPSGPIKGDVNEDGKVGISDVVAVINLIAGF